MKRAAATSGVLGNAGRWFTALVITIAAVAGLMVNAQNLGLTSWLGSVDLGITAHAARRIVVAPRADTLLAIGDTAVLAVTITDRRGAVLMGALVDWKSDDTSVAVVDTTGLVIARGPGTARVTAQLRDLSAVAHLTVIQKPERMILASDSTLRVLEGDTTRLRAYAVDRRGHTVRNKATRWQSGDSTIAVVDSTGLVLARGPGRTTLRSSIGGLESSVSLQVDLAAATLGILSGAGQRGPAGRSQAEPIVLLVLSRGGLPVPGSSVALTAEEGSIDPSSGVTDKTGRLRANWTLGPCPGPQRLRARVLALDSTVTITAEADPVPGNTRVELVGAPPTGDVGAALEDPVVVRVTDSTGTPLPDIPVNLTVLDRGGVSAAAERTDSLGRVSAKWVLGPRSGPQRLRVEVGNPRTLPPFTVSGTALPGPAAAIAIKSGMRVAGIAGRPLAQPVIVTAVDAGGNPVLEATVRVHPRNGSVTDTAPKLDTQGRAMVQWTLGDTAGVQVLEVGVSGVGSPARVTAVASAGAPTRLAVKGDPGKAGAPIAITATVTDTHGNPVAKAPVAFAANGGKVITAKAVTDQAGHAATKWTPGTRPATQMLTVRLTGTKVSASYTAPPPPSKPADVLAKKRQ
jgi:Bacterial Ig-like domain (group 1)/Bacterial Ig-like domain (group 2)